MLESKTRLRGLRFQKLIFFKHPTNNKFFFYLKKNTITPNFYQTRFKRKVLVAAKFDYQTPVFSMNYFCINIVMTFKKYYGVFKNILGGYVLLPLTECVTFGSKINFYRNALQFQYFLYIGSVIKAKFLKILFLVSNIGFNKPIWATSFGTYAIILEKTLFFLKLKLPSSFEKIVPLTTYMIIGRNSCSNFNNQYYGKASTIYLNKSRQVRGVAKNPVDHPHGGRTRGKMTFRTPWGLVAKKNK